MNKQELDSILELHRKWLYSVPGGKKADLRWADLSGADLHRAGLRGADLRGAGLSGADLSGADLHRADLRGADLRGADLHGADLSGADLHRADLRGAYLHRADLSGADLHRAGLRGADLRGADLSGADLSDLDKARLSIVPQEGSFIAWKKCLTHDCRAHALVKLLVPSDAKRCNAASRKCRVSKAYVLSITSMHSGEEISTAISSFDKDFVYRIGGKVEPDSFDENRWHECSNGIHCFITKEEAISYR